MQNLSKEEIKKRIEELEEQRDTISDELWKLKSMSSSYWVGIVDFDYDYDYHRLGFCTEAEANEIMDKIVENEDCLGYSIKEVSEDYNSKMYVLQNLEQAYYSLSMHGEEFEKYKELVKEIEKDKMQLKEELGIPSYARIAD